jgi:energy-coupling factor transporter ATP-binding protein EcfA2
VAKKAVADMTDEELAEYDRETAAERTAIRERQLEISAEVEFRRSMANLNEGQRRIVAIRLAGEATPTGGASAAKKGDSE